MNAEQPLYGGGNYSFVVRTDCWIAALTSPDVTICPGTPVTLDGSASAGCPSGLTHRWLDGTTVLCTSPTCGVTPAATTTYTLEVGCSSCTGPCTDTAAVTVTVRLDTIPPDQGNVLLAVKQLLDVVLDFTGAPAATWRLYRDGDKLLLGTTALAPDAATTSFTDPGAIPPLTALWFYRVKGLSPCSLTPGP